MLMVTMVNAILVGKVIHGCAIYAAELLAKLQAIAKTKTAPIVIMIACTAKRAECWVYAKKAEYATLAEDLISIKLSGAYAKCAQASIRWKIS